MARRALRKIDSDDSIFNGALTISDLPAAESREGLCEIFEKRGPIEVEVGTGKGLFLRNAAAAQPDRLFLGIEVARKYAEFVASRLARDEQHNARMVHGDAMQVFQEKLADNSVEDVHIYFPDPWWKSRHRRRRIVNESFVGEIERVLTPGGRLHFWTDVEEYFQSGVKLIMAHTSLDGPSEVQEDAALHDLDYRTHFERRVRLNDLPVYRALFHKQAWQVEVATGLGMPHSTITETLKTETNRSPISRIEQPISESSPAHTEDSLE